MHPECYLFIAATVAAAAWGLSVSTEPSVEPVETAFLSLASPAHGLLEVERTVHFLERADSDFVKRRDAPIFRGAIDRTMAFRLQSTRRLTRTDSLEILAQTYAFDHLDGRAVELGTVGVEDDHQGFGAMFLLGQLAIVHVCELGYDLRDEAACRMFALVALKNEHSERNLRKLGFQDPPDDHPGWQIINHTPESLLGEGKRLLALSPDGVRSAYLGMVAFAKDPLLRNRAGKHIRVQFGPRTEFYATPSFFDYVAEMFPLEPA